MSRVNSNINLRSSPRQVTPEKRSVRTQDNSSLNNNGHHSFRSPSHIEMRAVYLMCRGNQWDSVLNSIRSNRLIAITKITMRNNIPTTVLHQAITSKGDTMKRARVIQEILSVTPSAATIKNGYGCLPIHAILQRNTKMNSKTKEILIRNLMEAYPESLTQQGAVSMRTPVHIVFTDYLSPGLISTMLHYGRKACFMRDKNGFLPVHLAVGRHCSPEKLDMLLRANPSSLFATTEDGRSLLDLAKKEATKSHPNYALINEIERRLQATTSLSGTNQFNVQNNQDHATGLFHQRNTGSANFKTARIQRKRKPKRKRKTNSTIRREEKNRQPVKKNNASVKQVNAPIIEGNLSVEQANPSVIKEEIPHQEANAPIKQEESEEPANLLLHFSRQMKNVTPV
mmetsp:Transcript_4260/g.10127  ORF Transcript_4260/g.10127 Transcript_4260/m.10127 type:complete len:398 (-) Transcript_4260:353-1546(-)